MEDRFRVSCNLTETIRADGGSWREILPYHIVAPCLGVRANLRPPRLSVIGDEGPISGCHFPVHNARFVDFERIRKRAGGSPNSRLTVTAQFVIEDHALRHSWHHLARIREALGR